MDLIEAKIAEIKNLNLIYIFTIDSVLADNSNEYIGAQVVYDTDKTISLNYRNKHFNKFIKKILSRYNKEKEKRNIILLGDLTEQLVKDSSFSVIEEENSFVQKSGILVNRKKNEVKTYNKYLYKALKTILKAIKNYDCINIESIDGFNNKYIVNYSIGNIKKQLYMLIFVKEDGNLDFKISNIEGENVSIRGTVEDYFTIVKINWYDDVKFLKGSVIYNSVEKTIEENLYKETEPIIFRETTDTLLKEDEDIISFYLNLCQLNMLENVMKIDDNCYFLSEFKSSTHEKESIIYDSTSYQINIFDDSLTIKSKQKVGISKYSDRIKVVLSDITTEFILKKIEIDNKFYILIEKRTIEDGKVNYNYSVLSLEQDVNLSKPFNVQDRYEIDEELKSFDMAKQYIRGGK